MIIYDITRELFSAPLYPGDEAAHKDHYRVIDENNRCNLTRLFIGSHNGTHLDAPLHFIANAGDVASIPLDKCIGTCFVVEFDGLLTKTAVEEIAPIEGDRLLLKGNATIMPDGAKALAELGINLLGVEKLTVGDAKMNTQTEVHQTLLGAEIVIVESLDLSEVEEGEYTICALPLKMEGLDGSPVRAVLYRC